MRPNTRAIFERFIRDGIEHALMNSDVEVPKEESNILASEIEDRIWLYIDEYFTFDYNS